MTTQQRQAWSVVGAMFVTIAITWGVGFDIVGLFYDSFFKEFGWTHAHFALLSTSFSVSLFVGGLTVGWLLDHVEAKIVVTGGALTAMAGLLLAGQAHSFEVLMVAYFLLGFGNAAAAVVSLPLVINNWFTEGRRARDGSDVDRAPDRRDDDGVDGDLHDPRLRMALRIHGPRRPGPAARGSPRPRDSSYAPSGFRSKKKRQRGGESVTRS